MLIFISLLAINLSYGQENTRIYKYKSDNGVLSFSDIEPLNTSYEEIRVNCYACEVDSTINWYKAKLYLTQYRQAIDSAALRYNIDPAYIRAIIHAESHFDRKALSKQGAQGLMQLMPATARELGVYNPFIAYENIHGGVKHLAKLLKVYQGNNRLASAAYNAGEGAVKRYSGIPPFAETKVYVERVAILHRRYRNAVSL